MLAGERLAFPSRLHKGIVEHTVEVATGETVFEGVPGLGEAALEQHEGESLPLHDRSIGSRLTSAIESGLGLGKPPQVEQAHRTVEVGRPALETEGELAVGPIQRGLEILCAA